MLISMCTECYLLSPGWGEDRKCPKCGGALVPVEVKEEDED